MKFKWTLMCVVLIHSQSQYECDCLHEDTRLIDRPGQNLCAKENYYKDVDCSNQVDQNPGVSCLMRYINKTSKECSDSDFTGEIDTSEHHGIVKLKPFAWFDNSILFPSLNITFTKIKWEHLKMRFIKIGSPAPTICREFWLSGEVSAETEISFDCLWGNGATAEEHYRFQYMLTTAAGHRYLYTYLLQIPKDTDVEEDVPASVYRLFIIMDKTAFPLISLKVQVPPTRLNISKARVVLFYQEELDGPVEEVNTWFVDLAGKPEGDFVEVEEFDTDNTPGYYYYNASFTNSLCDQFCTEVSTPQLYVAGLRHGVQVTVAVIIISLAVLALVTFMLWRKKYKKLFYDGEKPPVVLLIYESSFPSHIENIYKFKQFIEENCYVAPKLDLVDIPKSDSMNPWRWYYKAFEEADVVLVFASPSPDAAEPGLHEDNVYQGLHAYATRLLAAHLSQPHRFSAARVRLPGCSWDTLPPEARGIQREFTLPEKLSHLLKFLGVPPLSSGGSRLLSALQQPRPAPSIVVAPPSAPLALPGDGGGEGKGEEPRGPLTTRGGLVVNLDGTESEESSGGEEEEQLTGFRL